MSGEILYLDSSALVKLIVAKPETGALEELLERWPHRASGEIAVVEVMRAARRATGAAAVHSRAEEVLAAMPLVRLDRRILEAAAELQPTSLCSLDAIHLASALALGPDLGAFVVYDERLAAAARTAGCSVLSPGI